MPQPDAGRLLQPGDPPPFEIFNKDGAGRVLLICDHAGRPSRGRSAPSAWSQAELARHIAWDIGIARRDAAAVAASRRAGRSWPAIRAW